ncbi:uncharacterized protein [Choristoneura fumiferana]|uniref:uncharacterized protein n=1 Tax=Choristoneura fumiferana TaxID=7141 RepID=UPI003D155E31
MSTLGYAALSYWLVPVKSVIRVHVAPSSPTYGLGGEPTPKAGKPAGPKPTTSTASDHTGPAPPQGGAKPKAGATPDVSAATGQPEASGSTTGGAADLKHFDEAWTLVDHRRGKGKSGKAVGSASGAGTSQAGSGPAPKRKSKKQRQRQKERAKAAKAAKREATALAKKNPKIKGNVKFAKGAAGSQGNQVAGRGQRNETQGQSKAGAKGPTQATAKRNRHDDTQSPRGGSKKPRLEEGAEASYAEAVRSELLVAVTAATGEPLTAQASAEIQARLQEQLLEQAVQETGIDWSGDPQFRGKPILANGALKLWCEDHETVEWLTKTIAGFTLSTGTGLMVKRQCDLVRMVRCGVLLPGDQPDIWKVGRALRYQNKWARVDSWLLHKVDRQEGDTFLIFSAPEDVVQTLIERERRLCYMLGSVYVKFQGPKGKFTEHLPTDTGHEEEATGSKQEATGSKQAKGMKPREHPADPKPPPQAQSSPLKPTHEAEDEEELLLGSEGGSCAAGLGNLALGGSDWEEMEVLSSDGEPKSPNL